MSFSTALVTWKAANLGSDASTSDRQAVAESVVQNKNRVQAETRVRAVLTAFAEYQADKTTAEGLQARAEQLRTDGDTEGAKRTEDESNRVQGLANDLFSKNRLEVYIDAKDESKFNEQALRNDLLRADEEAARANPDGTARTADGLRSRSQRLVGFLPILVLAIVILTVAQITARRRVRPWMAGAATVIWLVALIVALAGDKA
ncbi:MAG: hypothetical protein QOG64_2871 [Acidimicrobiaceae bacterium]|nr:hypothetical protein [Acidimicrobiaceae bacterium]